MKEFTPACDCLELLLETLFKKIIEANAIEYSLLFKNLLKD
jgi:hypothetical protein